MLIKVTLVKKCLNVNNLFVIKYKPILVAEFPLLSRKN